MSSDSDSDKRPKRAKPQRKKAAAPKEQTRKQRIIRMAIIIAIALGILGTTAVAGFVIVAWAKMPALETIQPRFLATSFVYDLYGEEVTGLAGLENRVPVTLDQMADTLKKAFLAHEDKYFYDHHGFVLRRIIAAAYYNVTGGRFQGGSTITQQLARSAFLTMDQTYTRKVQELILAVQFERIYTKDEILEMYLNQITLGHGAYGVEAAARNYFGKSAKDLNLAESAIIAGIAKSPTPLSPYRNLEGAKAQQKVVLNQMVEEGFVTRAEADAAMATELVLPGITDRTMYPYPFFIDYVLKQLLDVHKLDSEMLYGSGLKIYTTLDPKTQEAAEAAVATYSQYFPTNAKGEKAECGIVVMENETGYLKAIVGGVEHTQKLQFNFATESKRQPGSSFKPIVDYTPAIDLGYAPSTVVDDAPVTFVTSTGETWMPSNYDDQFRGLVTFRYALERSINVPAAKVLSWIGIRTGLDYAIRMGIDNLVTTGTANDVTHSLSLGALTYGVSPLELTRAYAVLGNKGIKVAPLAVLRVEDAAGNILIENTPKKEVVISEQTAWLVTDMLVGVISQSHGTGTRARLDNWVAAGKTGTSSDYADAWFAGYTPKHSAAVWLGYPKERVSMGVQFGGMYPALIWKAAMVAVHEDLTPVGFERPVNIVEAQVCRKSGKLPGPNCPQSDIVTEVFLKGTEPTEVCTTHVSVQVCLDDPLRLASDNCPAQRLTWRTFIRRPEPYVPYITSGGSTLVPADAAYEVPTGECRIHGDTALFVPDRVIEVKLAGAQFNPSTIQVARGTHLRLALTAVDRTYSVAIQGYNLSMICPGGQTVYLDFVANTAGTFTYFCNMDIGDDRLEMVGKLVVSGG